MTIPFPSTPAAPSWVDITILGRRYRVRSDVSLVWVLYDEGYIAASNQFCWNGTCLYCAVTLLPPNATIAVKAKACEVFPSQGLAVIKLGGEFRLPARLAS